MVSLLNLRFHLVRLTLLIWLGLLALNGPAAEIRLTFLDDTAALNDTCDLLLGAGIAAETVATFREVVADHNQPGNRVDRSKFPPARNGYYHFRSFNDLTNRTVRGFSETPGNESLQQHTLMCFDVACLLLDGLNCDAPLVEADFSSKRFVTVANDGALVPCALESFRVAAGVLCPTNHYEILTGRARSVPQTRLGLSLRAKRRLPDGCSQSDKDLRALFATRMNDLKRDGFSFPKETQLGLCYVVNTRKGYVWGDHCFLCFKRGGRFICVEKNGPKGPYVRVEFKTKKDMARYMSWDLLLDVGNPETPNAGSAVMVSLNEQLIGVFRPKTLP